MKKILALIMSLTFLTTGNNIAYAESVRPILVASDNDVVFIEKGVETPFKGYLFPEAKALTFRKQLIELDTLKALETSYNKSIDLYKKNEDIYNYKVNVLLEQNDRLSDALYKSKDRDTWSNRFWFALGIIVTSSSVYLATKLH